MKLYFIILLSLLSSNSFAAFCSKWKTPSVSFELSGEVVPESSGISVSKNITDRFYHINDSGGGPYFYYQDGPSGKINKIEIKNYSHSDFEDTSFGTCFENKSCLFIGDIGDNDVKRKSVRIVMIEEVRTFSSTVSPLNVIQFQYPDGAHNAEGIAVHPNGDLYILTKEVDEENHRAVSAKLYRLTKNQLQNTTETAVTATLVGSLELPYILYNFNLWGRIVTGFDISPDGKRFLILTYQTAVEVNIDLSNNEVINVRKWDKNNYNIIPLIELKQQESISYNPDGKSFLYTSEYKKSMGIGAPVYQVTCEKY